MVCPSLPESASTAASKSSGPALHLAGPWEGVCIPGQLGGGYSVIFVSPDVQPIWPCTLSLAAQDGQVSGAQWTLGPQSTWR